MCNVNGHFDSNLSLLKADALWCEQLPFSDSNPRPVDPTASVPYPLYQSAPQYWNAGYILTNILVEKFLLSRANVDIGIRCVAKQTTEKT